MAQNNFILGNLRRTVGRRNLCASFTVVEQLRLLRQSSAKSTVVIYAWARMRFVFR
jgi:hypothetical protein